ncbi:MAG: Hpt domain-containing protein [Oscillospiraceae bacterium]|nr:Hpt domain-containing protein [Oscillospiraceae bacterium]
MSEDLLTRLSAVSNLSVKRAMSNLGISEAAYERILRLTAALLPEHISRLQDAPDPAALAAEAHALKGVLSNIGASELSEQAAALETEARQGTVDRRGAFCGELSVLYEELTAALSEQQRAKPEGKADALAAQLSAIALAARNYELPLAQKLCERVYAFSYGAVWDERLEKLQGLLGQFDADGACALIDEWGVA